MKKIASILSAFILSVSLFISCTDDEGNYSYLTYEEVGDIVIDTIGIPNRQALQRDLNPGDHIEFEPNVTYKYAERLRYRWFYLTLRNGVYAAQQVGNALVYPPADTIAYTKKLDWTVDLNAGTYRFYLMAEDSVTGAKSFYQAEEQYIQVNQSGTQSGLYLLMETTDGNSDIGVLGTSLQLITGAKQLTNYYSELKGKTIPGKPRFIRGATNGTNTKDSYMVGTDQELYRINKVSMQLMNNWESMFYNTPETFNPQTSHFKSYGSYEFLINNGKLHTIATKQTNDGLLSDAISGDYEAASYLRNTNTPYAQVIYDCKNHRFRPYYANQSSISNFRSTGGSAYIDANKLPVDPIAILNGYNYQTYCIVPQDGTRYLYRFNFAKSDDGDFSADGERSKIDLATCTNIMDANYFAATVYGTALYYATDNALYSFSPSSGSTTARTIYECNPGEVITCIYASGSDGGGWPTSAVCFYVATWNENAKEGKVVEYEMDHYDGVPIASFGPIFGSNENPTVTTGWGKVVSMCWLDAE